MYTKMTILCRNRNVDDEDEDEKERNNDYYDDDIYIMMQCLFVCHEK